MEVRIRLNLPGSKMQLYPTNYFVDKTESTQIKASNSFSS